MKIPNHRDDQIVLSLEPTDPTVLEEYATLTVDSDSDSSFDPDHWIWLMFTTEDEPAFRLTYDEADQLYDRLGVLLGRHSE